MSRTLPVSLDALESKIEVTFKKKRNLETALIHKSYGNEHHPDKPLSVKDNERLEFLGDAVLELVVSEMLLETYPDLSEGDLSKLRASLVNEKSLAETARAIDLGDFLKLGKGEDQSGGRTKDSILASAIEALIAAVYEDQTFAATRKFVSRLFKEKVNAVQGQIFSHDHKTRLQEISQAKFKQAPIYEVVETQGPDHDKTFVVAVHIEKKRLCSGRGKSKKEAEQDAAKLVFEQYGRNLERLGK